MRVPLYQVDAFTDRLFGGNPAAVCPLDSWLPDDLLQQIAAENNLSETAYIVPSDAADHEFDIRWFTPTSEADLCGHATLAAAWVVQEHLGQSPETVRFQSRSGILGVTRDADRLVLDFPAKPAVPTDPVPALAAALGREPEETLKAMDYLTVFGSERAVAECPIWGGWPDWTRAASSSPRRAVHAISCRVFLRPARGSTRTQ